MTRASLLHILDHISEISDVEVRELEQLATTFPYCQTAHLLLAKAAHDRGSMLASQRLRRAATYATDRQLLRQLIEFTVPAPVPMALPVLEMDAANATGRPDALIREDEANHLVLKPTLLGTEADSIPVAVTPDPLLEPASSEAETTPAVDNALEITSDKLVTKEVSLLASEQPATSEAEVMLPQTAGEQFSSSTSIEEDEAAGSVEVIPIESSVDAAADVAAEPLVGAQEEVIAEHEPARTQASTTKDEAAVLIEEFLPAVAPPIRPPLETGSSQFEFGLSAELPPSPAYELIESENAEAEATTENSLVAPSAFYGVEDVGYGFGAGSRLGYCLVSLDESASTLPLGSFEPDALILAHLAAHQAAAAARTSVDIISQFLRNKPRMKAPTVLSPIANEQTDLSVNSTRAEPELASESLALIMVRQGKKERAIEIYERLMVRQPEKMAYFADQIQKLKLSE